MIKKNGQKIAALAIAATIIGQNVQPILAIENVVNQLSETQQTIEKVENSNTSSEEVGETSQEESKGENAEEVVTNEAKQEASEEETDLSKEETKDAKKKASVDFSIMAISDLHANLMNYDYYTGGTTNSSGLVKVSTLINQYKDKVDKKKDDKKIDNALVVDNGDTIEGTPLANFFAKKKPVQPGTQYPVYKALEEVGFDATTIGNHELNYGLDFIKQITNDNNSMATVCANVNDAKTGKPVFDPYKIVEEKVIDSNGEERTLKIGITGVVPPQVMNWDALLLKGKINVNDMTESVKKYVPQMKAEGADIVLVLAHTGYGDENTPNAKNKENAGYDIANVEGVDLVIGGHVHRSFKKEVKKANGDIVQYIQPLNNGRELGVAELKIDLEENNGKVEYKINDAESKIDTVSVKDVPNDEVLVQKVKEYHDATENYVNTPSGEITKDLNSFFTLVADDASVQIVTDAQRKFVEKSIKDGEESLVKYKDLPLLSAGAPFKAGSSAGNYVDIKAGGLALKDLSNLYKYDNTLTVIKLKGKDIKEWLELSVVMFNTIDTNSKEEQDLINRDFPTFNFDVIDGVNYEIDVTQKPKYDKDGNTINANSQRIVNLTYNGKPINLEQDFLIATNNYRAGGNGFPWNGKQEIVYSGTYENRQAVADYIETAGKLEPTVDNNWKFKSVDTDAKVIFTSHENGAKYLGAHPQIKSGENIGDKLVKYSYDLSYVVPGTNEKPEENKPGINKPETNKPGLNNSTTNNTDNPKTGDTSIIGYVVLGGAAAAGLAVTSIKRKRK
ncbi:bifunctional 2',3'-cyclic-nucleotide 2'-phosphodiesterase/3'-nucleotidase [[Clostridium] dakarense]|uniref:bifunctional 2',3'-cyclic-nucleotide 2'-phosphodiesterase/3'-nucleotidase n=1 Tax=Faecalimicrobium dakarense TaxID=1301100 RepID=UPI0004B7970E|nr:bifunctional 2',3'-cyclic-nucleotide 2'-phosphodiesterase/3'-nucleotidase [[Clostridium] dakarense]